MIKTFILFLSGFKKDVIEDCKIDKFHAITIGILLLIIGIYATCAWCFFFQTVWSGWYIYLAGLLMGSYIVCFDRSLIAAMAVNDKTDTIWETIKKYSGVVFRFLLAILFGMFLSQPMILKFYQSDVQREAQFIRIGENQSYQNELDSIYLSKLVPFQNELTQLISDIKSKESLFLKAQQDYKDEMDKNGGTGIYGYGSVAKNKEKIQDDHKTEYNDLVKRLNPQIEKIRNQIDSINKLKNVEFEIHREGNTISGTLIQARALKSLIKKDETGTLSFRYYLLSIILTLIELSALIVKLFFRFQSYQSRVSLITDTEENNSKNNKEISLETSDKNKNKLKTSFSEQIDSFYAKTKPVTEKKLDEMIDSWEANKDMPLRDFCQSFMDKLLIQGISLDVENNGRWFTNTESKVRIYNTINSLLNNFLVRTMVLVALAFGFSKFFIPNGLEVIGHVLNIMAPILSIMVTIWNKISKKYNHDN